MEGPANALELIETLRRKNGKEFQNFSQISQYLGLKAREKGTPVSCQFELTPLCNFSCKMCYVHLNPEQMNGQSVLSVDTWKNLMYQAWEAGMLQAILTGGECLAYPGFDELFLYLHSLGCEVSVLTNGFLLDAKRIQFFQEHKPSRIQITLYGPNDDVYERVTGVRAFHTVTNNARKAIEAGLPVSINLTPNSFLGEDVFETLRIAREICKAVTVNSCIFAPRKETGRGEQKDDPETELYLRIYHLLDEMNGLETKEIAEEKLPPTGSSKHECDEKGLLCGAGRSGFVMDWKGTMIPCNRLEIIRAYPLRDGFKAAWMKINQEANQWPRVPECEDCVYHDVCNNCAGNMLRFAEPGQLPMMLCKQTKQFVSHGVRHISECG